MSVHLRLPLSLGGDGSFRTVAEDSPEEVLQNVLVVLRTRPGERLATPDLGVRDPVFDGLDVAEALAEVAEWEPRADVTVVEQALSAEGVQSVRLDVRRQT